MKNLIIALLTFLIAIPVPSGVSREGTTVYYNGLKWTTDGNEIFHTEGGVTITIQPTPQDPSGEKTIPHVPFDGGGGIYANPWIKAVNAKGLAKQREEREKVLRNRVQKLIALRSQATLEANLGTLKDAPVLLAFDGLRTSIKRGISDHNDNITEIEAMFDNSLGGQPVPSPSYPFETPRNTVAGQKLEAAQLFYSSVAEQVAKDTSQYAPQRQSIVDSAKEGLSLADAAYQLGDVEQGDSWVKFSLEALDLAVGFVPGLSFGKDVASLATGVNPITGEKLSDVEYAFTAATLFAPAAIAGTAGVLTKLAKTAKNLPDPGQFGKNLLKRIEGSDLELEELTNLLPCQSRISPFIEKNSVDSILDFFWGSSEAIASPPCGKLGEISDAVFQKGQEVLSRLRSGEVGFGTSTSKYDYNKRFKSSFPSDAPNIGQVHHAVEKQVLKDYPGVISESEMHSLMNLRGIPKGALGYDLHQSKIRRKWNNFYQEFQDAGLVPTKEELLEFAKTIDDEFGHLFIPPIR